MIWIPCLRNTWEGDPIRRSSQPNRRATQAYRKLTQVLRSIPEQGQLAVVRQRRYVVTDVRRGAHGAQLTERPQHLVSLTSIEDDALGEELQVIWEIEPGARAFEKM